MIKLCLLAITVFTLQVGGSNHGRSAADNPPSIRVRAMNMTRALAAKVNLEEGQYVKVKQLNEQMLTEVEAIKKEYVADQVVLDQHLAEAQTRYDAALLDLLHPIQVAAYKQARASMTALTSSTK